MEKKKRSTLDTIAWMYGGGFNLWRITGLAVFQAPEDLGLPRSVSSLDAKYNRILGIKYGYHGCRIVWMCIQYIVHRPFSIKFKIQFRANWYSRLTYLANLTSFLPSKLWLSLVYFSTEKMILKISPRCNRINRFEN